MNEVVKSETGHGNAPAVVATGVDAFARYAEAVNTNRIVGDLLKFSKGDYFAGQDEKEVAANTRVIANMNELYVGWVRWMDGKPTDQVMGKIVDGYVPPRRDTLGDTDKEMWEVSDKGELKDPWQLTNYIILKDENGDQIYTFAGSSKGSIGAIGKLCEKYSRGARMNAGKLPIITLGVDKYKHKNADYGWIKTPKFDVVGWVDGKAFTEALAAAEAEAEAREDSDAATEAAAAGDTSAAKKTSSGKTRF